MDSMQQIPSWQASSFQSRNFPHFMEHKCSLPFTTPCQLCLSWARLICSMPSHRIYLKSVLILSSHLRLGLPCDLFPLCLPPCMHFSSLAYVLHGLPISFHHFDNLDDTGWGGQILKLLIMKFYLAVYYFLPHKPKCLPQHPILEHPQTCVSPTMWQTKFYSHIKKRTIL